MSLYLYFSAWIRNLLASWTRRGNDQPKNVKKCLDLKTKIWSYVWRESIKNFRISEFFLKLKHTSMRKTQKKTFKNRYSERNFQWPGSGSIFSRADPDTGSGPKWNGSLAPQVYSHTKTFIEIYLGREYNLILHVFSLNHGFKLSKNHLKIPFPFSNCVKGLNTLFEVTFKLKNCIPDTQRCTLHLHLCNEIKNLRFLFLKVLHNKTPPPTLNNKTPQPP